MQTPPESAAPPPRPRNRSDTRASILDAAKALLADEGFSGFGINALARRSGFDKQLIYRYFGGLEGLVDAIGDSLAGWTTTHLEHLVGTVPGTGYGTLLNAVLMAYLDALRADLLMQKIIAWEVSDPSPHVRRMADQRSRNLGQWVARLRGDRTPASGLDAPALNAVLIGAVQHLVLSSAVSGQFVGVPLAIDADWDRIKAMLARIVRALHNG